MQLQKYVKNGLKMLIESDANLTTMMVRAGKKQLLAFLDRLIPD
jgi:hypothetical protein